MTSASGCASAKSLESRCQDQNCSIPSDVDLTSPIFLSFNLANIMVEEGTVITSAGTNINNLVHVVLDRREMQPPVEE